MLSIFDSIFLSILWRFSDWLWSNDLFEERGLGVEVDNRTEGEDGRTVEDREDGTGAGLVLLAGGSSHCLYLLPPAKTFVCE